MAEEDIKGISLPKN